MERRGRYLRYLLSTNLARTLREVPGNDIHKDRKPKTCQEAETKRHKGGEGRLKPERNLSR